MLGKLTYDNAGQFEDNMPKNKYRYSRNSIFFDVKQFEAQNFPQNIQIIGVNVKENKTFT